MCGGDPEGVLQTTFRRVKCLAAETPKSAITRVFSEGHEGEVDTLVDGGKVMIEGKGLAGATECTISCKDVAGNEHSSTYHHIDPEFSLTDTLVTIDEDAIVTAMRAWCDEADSSLDIPAGGTVKLTLSDGTELTRHVSFGE